MRSMLWQHINLSCWYVYTVEVRYPTSTVYTCRLYQCGIRTLDLSRILPALQYINEPPNSSYTHFAINIMLHTNDNFTMGAGFTIMMTRLTFLRLWITDADVLQKRPLNNVATRNKFPCEYIDHTFVKYFNAPVKVIFAFIFVLNVDSQLSSKI